MSRSTRRRFLQKSATFGIGIGLFPWQSDRAFAANDKISVACIGVRGRGNSVMRSFAAEPDCEITHICDVRESVRRQRGAEMKEKTGRMPTLVNDYRDLLNDKSIDVFMVATPDHWHALLTIEGCLAGKDVYVEKPGSHNIFEGKKVVEAAKKYNRIVQVGSQSRSNPGMQEGIQKLRDGAIGEVYMAKGLCYKWRGPIGKVDGPQEPPDTVDYDLWLGPAPEKPLMRRRLHYDWHWMWDYGNGDIGNQGIHEMDKARWGLGVDWPTEVHSTGAEFEVDDDRQTPNNMLATFRYPDTNKILVFEVRHWISNHEGGLGQGSDNSTGNIFYGSEGYMVMPNYHSYQIFLGRNREPQGQVSKSGNHYANFIDAVRSRKGEDLNAPVGDVRISAAHCHMANISYRTGRKLEWNAKRERFRGDSEANRMLTRKYRKPFVVPKYV